MNKEEQAHEDFVLMATELVKLRAELDAVKCDRTAIADELALVRLHYERSRAEIDTAKADVNRLNNLLRAVGWGQGEIDSAATIEEEAKRVIAERDAAKAEIVALKAERSRATPTLLEDGRHKELAEVVGERDALRAELAHLHDPAALHAHCLRYLTGAQVAHLFGERMTAIMNNRDAWRQCAEQLAAVVLSSDVERLADGIDVALAGFEKLKGGK